MGLQPGRSGGPPLLPPVPAGWDPFHGRRAEGPIVLLLIDGLGWSGWRTAATETPGVPSNWIEASRPITSVFPSTTTCALTSLSTAQSPSRHGVLGHRQFLPAWGTVADLLNMSPIAAAARNSILPEGVDTGTIRGCPTLFELGLPATVLTRGSFAGSGFTRMLYAGARFCSYWTAVDFAHELARLLSQPKPPPVIYAYWEELDTVLHRRGPDPELLRLEVERMRSLLATVTRRLPSARAQRTQLWITGDHGLVPVDPGRSIAAEGQPALLRGLRHPPTGDRRAVYLAVRPGELGRVRGVLHRLLPAGSLVKGFDEARRAGWFGPPPYHPELHARTGDLVVVPAEPVGFTYQAPGAATPFLSMRGSHGGLDRRELWVPWIAGSLAELGGEDALAPSRN
ncbi:MAG TPA: alkaline phosphatase family protein [Thermoplasmata archaeon]|nr:alkaline phosphatase family protein [Thermoplasmata archaeon]